MDAMKGTCIRSVHSLGQGVLPRGVFLLLVEPGRIPPHLALIEDGFYFSLSVKGVELEKDAKRMIDALDRKEKDFLMLGLGTDLDPEKARRAFEAYEGHEPPLTSCLEPIVLRLFGADAPKLRTVHGLIAHLREEGLLQEAHYSGPVQRIEGEFWIPPYEEADVRAHLDRYRQRTQEE